MNRSVVGLLPVRRESFSKEDELAHSNTREKNKDTIKFADVKVNHKTSESVE